MFEFRFIKKVLSPPFTKAIAASTDEALQAKNITDRVEKLLAVKEEANGSFGKAIARQIDNGLWFGVGSLLAGCAVGIALAAASVPLGIVALGLYAGSFAMSVRATNYCAAIRKSRDTVNDKIGSEVSKLSDSNPQEAVRSPRFLKALKTRFNLSSASEADVKHLLALFAPACVPAIPAATPNPTP